MRDIQSVDDVNYIVTSFYKKVQQNEMIGPIFNKLLISEEVWEQHFEILTNFWDAILFHGKNYKGQAVNLHVFVDSQTNRNIKPEHFHIWLNLWHDTLDESFTGERVEYAKRSAISLAQTFYSKMIDIRKNHNPSLKIDTAVNYTRNT